MMICKNCNGRKTLLVASCVSGERKACPGCDGTGRAPLDVVSADIRTHMARAFFACAWAEQCEESGNDGLLSGVEIMDAMPAEIDPAALHAASILECDFLRENRQFTCLGGALDWLQTVSKPGGDRPRTAEMLGHYLAMQSMGQGVGLRDAFGAHACDVLRVPYVEFGGHALQGDYFQAKGDVE